MEYTEELYHGNEQENHHVEKQDEAEEGEKGEVILRKE